MGQQQGQRGINGGKAECDIAASVDNAVRDNSFKKSG
jgi:hypothetical protein